MCGRPLLSWRRPCGGQEGEGAAPAVAGEVDLGSQSSPGSAEGMTRSVRLPLSAGRGSVLVSPDDGGVDLDQPVDVTDGVRSGQYLLHGPGEHAADCVAAEAGVDRLSGPVAFRQITPRDAGTARVDHPVDDLAVCHPRPPGNRP